MDLSPLIWQKIDATKVGQGLSVRLVKKEWYWMNPFSNQLFEAENVGAASGMHATFHCWVVMAVSEEGVVRIGETEASCFVPLPFHAKEDWQGVAEICAGIGGTSFGALIAGHEVIAAMDKSQLACDLLVLNGHTKVVQGDVTEPKDVKRFHLALRGRRVGLLTGFPCQPFSKLGSNLAFKDERAGVFFRVLDAAALVDASFILLECVSQAGENEKVKSTLDEFCRLAQFQWSSVNLHLDRALPTYRTRWWALLIPDEFTLPDLVDLPLALGRQRLVDVIPHWPVWPMQEERELSLTDLEKEFYLRDQPNNGQRFLDLEAKMPTQLHSIAHHLVDCPCGCRKAFRADTLRSGGVHGTLIRTNANAAGVRHPHPEELALLHGLPCGLIHRGHLRELLPMIGQIASPVQAHWMLIQLHGANYTTDKRTLLTKHESFIKNLLDGHAAAWPTPLMLQPREHQVQIADEAPITFKVDMPIRLHEIIQATEKLSQTTGLTRVFPHPPHQDPLLKPEDKTLYLRFGSGKELDWRELVLREAAIPPGLHEGTLGSQGQMLIDKAAPSSITYLTPLQVIRSMEGFSSSGVRFLGQLMDGHQEFMTLFWDEGHWIFMHGVVVDLCLQLQIYDGLRKAPSANVEQFGRLMTQALGVGDFHVQVLCLVSQTHGHHCGTIALLHMGVALQLWTKVDEPTAMMWYDALKRKQLHYGTGSDRETAVLQWLCNFLPSKGVHETEAMDRARASIRKLGLEAVEKATKEKDPWRALKALGNKLGKPFQWITVDELERHIQARSRSKYGTDTKGKRKAGQKKKVDNPICLLPEQLELVPDTFEDDDGDAVGMITLDNVKPDMRGIAIISVEQAPQYLEEKNNLSTDAFALLTIGELPSDVPDHAEAVQWLAIYKPTMEPIIIHGHLICLGDSAIKKRKAEDEQELAHVDTTVIRTQIFKDQFHQDWASLCAGPVKQLIQMIPALQLCKNSECDGTCKLFHCAIDEEVLQVALDVWNWRWLDEKYKPTKSADAFCFSVYLRVPLSGLDAILGYSGWSGIYFEPRHSERDGALRYATVWLPKGSTTDDALKFKRSSELVVGLARMHMKIGLRSYAKHEHQVLKLVYPDRQIVNCGIKLIYEMGPFPHSLSKDGVLKMLGEWKWQARPLRPLKSTPIGRFWEIGTSSTPPAPFLSTDKGPIAVTQKRVHSETNAPATFQATSKTLAHLKSKSSASSSSSSSQIVDPWAHGQDPWANYKGNTSAGGVRNIFTANQGEAEAPRKRLKDMEDRLFSKVQQQLQQQKADEMKVDSLEHTAEQQSVLQVEVEALRAQNEKFEHWFQETGTRMGNVEAHLQQQGAQILELGAAAKSQAQTTSHIQSELGSIKCAFKEELLAAMEAQGNKIEALLEKRHKANWQHKRCAGTQLSGARRFVPSWIYLLVIFGVFFQAPAHRFGEALHPGPRDDFGADDYVPFVLGTANVAGANNKIPSLLELPMGIWGLCETHLTSQGIGAVSSQARSLARRENRSLRFCHGAPAPPRVQDSESGKWTGVALMSDYPLRELCIPWRGEEYNCGRILVTTSFVNGTPISGATIYGAAQSPTFLDPFRITSDLFQTATEEVVDGMTGPRYLMGDFNISAFQLPQTTYWHSLGWRELQLHAQELWQYPVQPTCKGVTVRDFIWASPELLGMLRDVHVLPGIFPDHAAVYGCFECPSRPSLVQYWHMPHVIPWQEVHVEAWHESVSDAFTPFEWGDDLTRDFAAWSDKAERSIHGFVNTDNKRLPVGCRGRGRRNQMKRGPVQVPVMRPSRPGEAVLTSSICSMPVQRWFKQLRRLQSLLHSLRAGASSGGAFTYQALCWKAIRLSTGFHGGFSCWWLVRNIKLQGSPSSIPDCCPNRVMLECIYADFEANFRSFERWNLRKRQQLQQLKKEQVGKDLFRQLKPDPPGSLEVLQQTHTATIQEIHSATGKIRLSTELMPGVKALLNEEPIEVCPCDPPVGRSDMHWVEFESDTIPVPGQSLLQRNLLSTPRMIEDELIKLWLPRWQNSDHLDESAWTRILAFAHHYLPRQAFTVPDLEAADFRQAFTKGGSLQTRGPDGWAPCDFANMPDCLLTDLLSLFGHIEAGLSWPQQLTRGHVTCLEKNTSPEGVSDYRPVVLYSLLYRFWGSMRSRKLLADFSKIIDFNAHGFLAGRCCQHITFLNGWNSFLRQMTRSFVIHRQIGGEFSSNAGMPEGDSLSCLGMVIANYTFHFYMKHFRPSLTSFSFVDNLEVTGNTAVDALAGFVTTQVWAEMLQLKLDERKTQFWSTSPTERAALKAFGLDVIEQGKDLGASMQYSAKHRNCVLQDRIQSVAPYWNRLRNMHVSTWHKQLAIKQALLPRALHNVSHVVLGQHWHTKLRTRIMRALRFDRAGANPMLRLSVLADIDIDPGFYEFWHVLRDFKCYVTTNSQMLLWWAQHIEQPGRLTHGPFGKLMKLLPAFGWHIDGGCVLTILQAFSVDLKELDMKALRFLAEYFWRQHVAHSLVHRRDFADLKGLDFEASCQAWKPHDRAHRELLHCIQDGTFHLASVKSHFDPSINGLCPTCQEPDTLEHRALRCQRYQHIRIHYEDCCRLWPTVPTSCSHHGLCSTNEAQVEWWSHLCSLPLTPPIWNQPPRSEGTQMIFTDGSCKMPTVQPLSLASWAIVNACDGTIIGSGLLPQLLQTIGRAELWAIVLALDWALHYHCSPSVHSDSAYAIEGCLALQRLLTIPSHWADQDLWRLALWYIERLGDRCSFHKVRAHLDEVTAADETQAWCIYWNSIADANAKSAGDCAGSHDLRRTYQQLIRHYQRHKAMTTRFQQFLLDMALFDMEHRTRQSSSHADFEPLLAFEYTSNTGGFAEAFPVNWQQVLRADPWIESFGFEVVTCFVRWMVELEDSADFSTEVTLLEILMAFRLSTHVVLPILIEQDGSCSWRDIRSLRVGELAPRTMASQLSVFRQMLCALDRLLGCSFEWGWTSRPESLLLKPLESLHFPWPVELSERVHFELLTFISNRPIKRTADLAKPWL